MHRCDGDRGNLAPDGVRALLLDDVVGDDDDAAGNGHRHARFALPQYELPGCHPFPDATDAGNANRLPAPSP